MCPCSVHAYLSAHLCVHVWTFVNLSAYLCLPIWLAVVHTSRLCCSVSKSDRAGLHPLCVSMGIRLWAREGGGTEAVQTHNVSAELYEEDGNAAEGQGHADSDVNEVRRQFRDVLGQRVGDGLLQVVKDQSA